MLFNPVSLDPFPTNVAPVIVPDAVKLATPPMAFEFMLRPPFTCNVVVGSIVMLPLRLLIYPPAVDPKLMTPVDPTPTLMTPAVVPTLIVPIVAPTVIEAEVAPSVSAPLFGL